MILLTRIVDELGRIVLPAEMRQRANIEKNQTIDIIQDESGAIHISATRPRCRLCNGAEKLHQFDVGVVCQDCINKMRNVK